MAGSSLSAQPRPSRLRARTKGCEQPFSSDQMTSWVAYPLSTLLFVLCTAVVRPTPALLVPYAFVVCAVLAMYAFIECTDPAEEGGVPCPCVEYTQKQTKYDASSRKMVPGLDHFCTWLNTAIGKRNYVQFFVLIVAGLVQFALQIVLQVFYVIVWADHGVREHAKDVLGSYDALVILVWLNVALSALLFVGFGSLVGFHLYLVLFVRKGTYDWLVDQRKNQRSRTVGAGAAMANAASVNGNAARARASDAGIAATNKTNQSTQRDPEQQQQQQQQPQQQQQQSQPQQKPQEQEQQQDEENSASALVGGGPLGTSPASVQPAPHQPASGGLTNGSDPDSVPRDSYESPSIGPDTAKRPLAPEDSSQRSSLADIELGAPAPTRPES